MTVLAADLPAVESNARDWPAWKRIAFRYVCAYWIAFLVPYLPGFFDDVDPTSWPSRAARAVLSRLVPWVGLHVFGVTVPLTQSGSGDKLFDWVQAFCVLAAGILGGTAWCVIGRKRREHQVAAAWLRV